ncbi:hypothetical protein JTE90_021427 [Oedothorax gibbosus]|uniref:Kelch-like protein diablo n=1 Tax=Oedothorax gibbosus TaxID=931172 RepID=A0AAV6VE44_9ARAC|nr:hypothetical protein JTE90_021427 [Oedothorax gibbosus]
MELRTWSQAMANPQQLAFMDLFETDDFQRLQVLADATLTTDDGSIFKVHRMLLAYRNDYFRNLFLNTPTKNDNFLIEKIDSKLVDIILVHLYKGSVSLKEQSISDVLLASNRFMAYDLLFMCQEIAARSININNCLQIFVAACEIKISTLMKTCYRYVQVHFEEVILTTGNTIGNLNHESLETLLKDRNLNVTYERTAFMAIVRWTEMNQTERLPFVSNLLKYVYSKDLDTGLKKEILAHPIVKGNPYCRDLHECSGATEEEEMYAVKSERIPQHMNFVAVFRDVISTSHSVQLYLTYDDQVDMWRHIGEIDFWPDSLIRIKRKIFMFNSAQDRRMSFDLISGTLTQVDTMSFPRLHNFTVSLDDRIFAVGGGTDRDEMTSIVECYDPDTDTWELRSPMVPTILLQVAAFNGRLFAIGEDVPTLNNAPEMFAQVYDPSENSWTSISAPNVYRQQFASAVYQDHLYVIGGQNEHYYEYLKSVEAYDPHADTWICMPSLPFAYVMPKAVVLNQKLIVFENIYKSRSHGVCDPPVLWNPDLEIWEIMDPRSNLMDICFYQFSIINEKELLKELTRKNRSPNIHWTQSFLNLNLN